MSIQDCQAAISTWNEALGALRLPDAESPLSYKGDLRDLVVSVKDVIDVEGWIVTCNHRPFENRRCSADAPVVAAVRAAGAHLIGVSTTLEFAYGEFTDKGLYPPAHNPWALDRIPGGSSCGAGAAVASGMCDVAIATDTSGSVRGPAALCGVLGLKPSHGSITNKGIYPLADSLNVAGALARCPIALARVMSAMLGRPIDAAPAMPRRIGWLSGFDIDAGTLPVVTAAVQAMLDDLAAAGCEVIEIAPKHSLAEYHAACVVSLLFEAWQSHGGRLREERDGYDPRTWSRLTLGAFVTRETYRAAMQLREELRCEIDMLLESVDVIVTAGAPAPAGHPHKAAPFGMLRERFLLGAFSATGHPAMTIPIGFDDRNLPLSLQAVAPYRAESRLLGLAAFHRAIRPWQTMKPPVGALSASVMH